MDINFRTTSEVLGAELVSQLLASPHDRTILLEKKGDILELTPSRPKTQMSLKDVADELEICTATVRRKYLNKHLVRKGKAFLRSDVMDLKERIKSGELNIR